MREMQWESFRCSDRCQRGLDIAGYAQIVAMKVQRMGQPQFVHRLLECFHNGARGYAVTGHFIVERERAQIVLEGSGASSIDYLDTKSTRCGERPGHIIPHRIRTLAAMEEVEQKVIISEHRQRCFV